MAFSCAFVGAARVCPHETHELFRPEYQRTNRTNRTKIVRCFPHCCPRHVPRSYCGASMRLQVRAPVDTGDGLALDVHVFARFRSVETPAIGAGSYLPATSITGAMQTDRNPTAEWIGSRLLQAPFQGYDAWLFELNPGGRWYYAWDSGATKARRQTRHVLETVVVLTRDSGRSMEVVATLCSPSFTFVSFRRTADSETGEREPSLLYQALSWQMRQQIHKQSEPNHRQSADVQRMHPWHGAEQLNWTRRTHGESFVNPLLHRMDTVAFVAALGVLTTVVESLPIAEVSPALALWASQRRDSMNSTFSHSSEQQDAMDTAVELVWLLRTDCQLAQSSAQHFFSAVDVLLDAGRLHDAYSRWIDAVQEIVDRFLHERQWRMRELVAAVADEAPRSARHAYDWPSFVANVRQSSIDQQLQRLANEKSDLNTGLWSCDLGDVNIRGADHDGHSDLWSSNVRHLLLAGSVFFFWSQLSRLWIDPSELRTRNRLRISFSNAQQSQRLTRPLEFILDHRYRHFSSLPRGEASLSGGLPTGYSTGDYLGFVSPHSDRIHITTFVWPREACRDSRAPAYRWYWTMQLSTGSVLEVSVRVDVGLWHEEATACDPLETIPFQKKLAMVEGWQPVAQAVLPYTAAAGACS